MLILHGLGQYSVNLCNNISWGKGSSWNKKERNTYAILNFSQRARLAFAFARGKKCEHTSPPLSLGFWAALTRAQTFLPRFFFCWAHRDGAAEKQMQFFLHLHLLLTLPATSSSHLHLLLTLPATYSSHLHLVLTLPATYSSHLHLLLTLPAIPTALISTSSSPYPLPTPLISTTSSSPYQLLLNLLDTSFPSPHQPCRRRLHLLLLYALIFVRLWLSLCQTPTYPSPPPPRFSPPPLQSLLYPIFLRFIHIPLLF